MVKFRDLSKEEQDELLKKYYETKDPEIKKLLIEANIKFVRHITKNYYTSIRFRKEEMISTGIFGLIKAIETYNPFKGCVFSSYAGRCIINEINMELKNIKKHANVVSYDAQLSIKNDQSDINLIDTIESDYDVEDIGERNFLSSKIMEEVDKLPLKQKYIIQNQYELFTEKPKTQIEIAKSLGISKCYCNRLAKKAFENLRNNISKGQEEKNKIIG